MDPMFWMPADGSVCVGAGASTGLAPAQVSPDVNGIARDEPPDAGGVERY